MVANCFGATLAPRSGSEVHDNVWRHLVRPAHSVRHAVLLGLRAPQVHVSQPWLPCGCLGLSRSRLLEAPGKYKAELGGMLRDGGATLTSEAGSVLLRTSSALFFLTSTLLVNTPRRSARQRADFQKHQAGLSSKAAAEIRVEVVEETSVLTILRVPFEGVQRQALQLAAA
jgi:hypothetical protein